jgi:hypothetical protein
VVCCCADDLDLTTEKLGMNRNLAKNDGAGEGQQQLTGLDWSLCSNAVPT